MAPAYALVKKQGSSTPVLALKLSQTVAADAAQTLHGSLAELITLATQADAAPAITLPLPEQRWAFVALPDAAAAAAARAALEAAPLAAELAALAGTGTRAPPVVRWARSARGAALPDSAATDGGAGEAAIPGLILLREFVDAAAERRLLGAAGAVPWTTNSGSRRVAHFGAEFDYARRTVARGAALAPLPPFVAAVSAALVGCAALPAVARLPADQCTVNEYVSGQGISAHVETHSAFDGALASLSLGAPTVMDFRDARGAKRSVVLPPRSLLVLTAEARFAWSHAIAARKSDVVDGVVVPRGRRVSLTFRRVRPEAAPCRCGWPALCDSQLAPRALSLGRHGQAVEDSWGSTSLEREHVHAAYENRDQQARPLSVGGALQQLLGELELPAGVLVVDTGIGEPRCCALPAAAAHCVLRRGSGVGVVNIQGDLLSVPLRDGVADAVIAERVLDRFSTAPNRLRAALEAARVMRIGAVLVLSVALCTDGAAADAIRAGLYEHAFARAELEALLSDAGLTARTVREDAEGGVLTAAAVKI